VEDADHFLFTCPMKTRYWKYVRVMLNLWTQRHSRIHLDALNAQNIVEGFQFLGNSAKLKDNPTTMIILGMAISTLWKAHWKLIFEEQTSRHFSYDQLVNSLWSSLQTRIQDDTQQRQDRSIWIQEGIVQYSNSKVSITKPIIYIPS
jgi:hypothetical protein